MKQETNPRETCSDELLNAEPGQDIHFAFEQAQVDENTAEEIMLSERVVLASPKGYETDSTIGEFKIESDIESSQRQVLTPPKESPHSKTPISLLNVANHNPQPTANRLESFSNAVIFQTNGQTAPQATKRKSRQQRSQNHQGKKERPPKVPKTSQMNDQVQVLQERTQETLEESNFSESDLAVDGRNQSFSSALISQGGLPTGLPIVARHFTKEQEHFTKEQEHFDLQSQNSFLADDTVSEFASQSNAELTLGNKQQSQGIPIKTFVRSTTAYNGQDTLKHARSVNQRSFISRGAQQHLSPINTRRSEKEKSEARQKTQDKKRLMKMKREQAQISQGLFNQMVDEQTLVTVYQAYFMEGIEMQQKNFAQDLMEQVIENQIREVANECLDEIRLVEKSSQIENDAQAILDGMLMSATRSTCKQSIRQNNQSIESGIDLLCESLLQAQVSQHLHESLMEHNHQECVSKDAQWVYSEILKSTIEPQTRVTAIETKCEQSKLRTEELGQKAVDLAEPRVVADLIQSAAWQAGEQISQKQEEQMDEAADNVCERIAEIIIGQSVQSVASTERRTESDFEEKQPKPRDEPALGASPVETSIKNPLMDYMTQYAAGEVEKRVVKESIDKAIEEQLLLEYAFESVLRSILRDPSPKTTSTPLLSTIPMMSPHNNAQENKIYRNYRKMAPERRHGTIREPDLTQGQSPLKALETNQSNSQIKQVQSQLGAGQESQLQTQSQSSKTRKSSQNIADGKGSSVISITLSPSKKKSQTRQPGSITSNSTANILGSHGSTVVMHERSRPDSQTRVAMIDLQPVQQSPERANSNSPKHEQQTETNSSNMNSSMLEAANKRVMRTQDQPARREPNFVEINKKLAGAGARVSSRERSRLSNNSRYSGGGSVSPRSKSPMSNMGKSPDKRPTLIKNYVNSQYTIVPVTAISTTTLAGTAPFKGSQLSQTKSACSSRSARDVKSPLYLNRGIGKGLKSSNPTGAPSSSQRGFLQKAAYGSVPKLRETDPVDKVDDKAYCTVSRLEEPSNPLIENAYGQNESEAGLTARSRHQASEKGQLMDKHDQGLIQKLMQNSKAKENVNLRSRGTNLEKKANMQSHTLTKSQNHLLTTRTAQAVALNRDLTRTLAPSQSVFTMSTQRQGNKVTGTQVSARAPASVSKAHPARQQDLKGYSTNQSKKTQNSDNRSGHSSRHLFRRTLTPNQSLRQSGKVTEATFAAETESMAYQSNQSQQTQQSKQSPLAILVQNDLVACRVFDDMIRNQIRRIAGSYFQSLLIDHFYKRTLKKVVRMTLFQVIQESVDTIYFLEEDTISTANIVLDNLLRSEIMAIVQEAYHLEKGSASSRSRSQRQADNLLHQVPLTNRVPESSEKRFKSKLSTESRMRKSQRTLDGAEKRGLGAGQNSSLQIITDQEVIYNSQAAHQKAKQGSQAQDVQRGDLDEELILTIVDNEEQINKNININKLSPGPALRGAQYTNDPGFSRRQAITLHPIQHNEPIMTTHMPREAPNLRLFNSMLSHKESSAEGLRSKQQTSVAKRSSPLLNKSARRHKVNPFFPSTHGSPQKNWNQTQTRPLNLQEILRQGNDERPATSQYERASPSPLRYTCTDQEDQMSYISNASANLASMKQGHNLTPRLTISSSPSKRILPKQYLGHSKEKDNQQKRSFVDPKQIVDTEDQEMLCEVVSSGDSEQKCEFAAGSRNTAVKQSMNTNTLTVLDHQKFQPNKRFTLSPAKNETRLLMPSQTHGNLHLRKKY